jgi:hypothetical protein
MDRNRVRKSQSGSRRAFSHAPSSAEFVDARDSARKLLSPHNNGYENRGLQQLGSRDTVQADLSGS